MNGRRYDILEVGGRDCFGINTFILMWAAFKNKTAMNFVFLLRRNLMRIVGRKICNFKDMLQTLHFKLCKFIH